MHLLLALRFFWKCDTELELGRDFKIKSHTTVEKWIRIYTSHLSKALDLLMPSWEDTDDGFTYFLSVDGTHCPINEPRPFSEVWSSFKFGGSAGLNYEFGLQINRDKLIWLCGRVPCGETNDCGVFKRALKPRLLQFGRGKLIVADSIYSPDTDLVATRNDYDPPEVARFKERVCARHEFFNHYVKLFQIFKKKFRHESSDSNGMMIFHGECMRAVLAVQCTQLDNGSINLFDPYP